MTAPLPADAVQCRTCGVFQVWPDDSVGGPMWAVQHSRETGHPDSYHMIQVAPLPAEAYVPVPMRWRLVRPGDVVLDPDGRPWMTDDVSWLSFGTLFVHLSRGDDVVVRPDSNKDKPPFDPDATVDVLIPLAERDAVIALREGLGDVRVLERRTG